jgi:hypothetical protein
MSQKAKALNSYFSHWHNTTLRLAAPPASHDALAQTEARALDAAADPAVVDLSSRTRPAVQLVEQAQESMKSRAHDFEALDERAVVSQKLPQKVQICD